MWGMSRCIGATVMYWREIGRGHLLPELFESGRLVLPCPGRCDKELPGRGEVCQGPRLILLCRAPEQAPQRTEIASVLHKRLKIDAAEDRR
jgi:hypothetical protein